MALKNVLLLCGIFGLQSLANGLTATSELRGASPDAHAANHGMTAQATSSWVVTSLYYSSNCATTTTAPFIDGAQANTCLVSTEQPNESFVYTCNAGMPNSPANNYFDSPLSRFHVHRVDVLRQ